MEEIMKVKLVTALAWAVALAGTPALAQVSNDVVKIGVLTDMAGVTADITGKGSVAAAEMAVKDFGGTVLGKPIQIVVGDHQHKADLGASIARQWYDADGVDVIVDVPNSAVALGVQALSAQRKKLVIYSGAGTTALTNAQCSPYGIHWTYDTYGVASGTAAAVTKSGGKDWYMIAADYAFGTQLHADAKSVIEANGGKIVGSVKHPLNTPDYSSYLLQAQASGAKVVGLANAGGDTVNAIKQGAEFGLSKKGMSFAALIMFVSDVHSLGLPIAQGTYLTTASYWDQNEKTRAWSKSFNEKTGLMPSMLQTGVYGSVLHYLKAVQKAGTDDADKVSAAMREIPIDDIFSTNAKIREDGKVVRDMWLARVKTPEQSKYPWDYFEIIQQIPAEETVWPLSKSTCPLVKK
jgi:branched-chain amino acid transport system substrate-binding protein